MPKPALLNSNCVIQSIAGGSKGSYSSQVYLSKNECDCIQLTFELANEIYRSPHL